MPVLSLPLHMQGASSLELIHVFDSTGDYNSPRPVGLSLLPSDGRLYGVLQSGGTNYSGALFSLDTDGTEFTEFVDFGMSDVGRWPISPQVELSDGKLIGVMQGDEQGYENGGIYTVETDGTGATKLYQFNSNAEGSNPGNTVTLGPNGIIWGTLSNEGTLGHGSVFEFNTKTKQIAVLHAFNDLSASAPRTAPILGQDGKLYGTAWNLGTGQGIVYRMATDGSSYEVLHTLYQPDGMAPVGTLLQGPDGRIYGATRDGGVTGSGVVFSLRPDGSDYRLLHEFGGYAAGASPAGGVIFGSDGRLYGVTKYSASTAFGLAYALNTDGSDFEIIHYFDQDADGGNLQGELVLGPDGRLYGTSPSYGPAGGGTVFAITVGSPSVPEITEGQSGHGAFGTPFLLAIECLFAPTEFSVDGALPAGLSIDGATGIISGTPVEAGSFEVPVTGSNEFGSGSGTVLITIDQVPADIRMENLRHFYDGTPKSVSVYVYLHPEVPIIVTYNGSTTPPTEIGYYTVVATPGDPNYTGTVTDEFIISDPNFVKPEITKQPEPHVVEVGETITMSVEYFGSGPLRLTWTRNGIPIEGANGPTLHIGNATLADNGEYQVGVVNPFDGVSSNPARVSVFARTENDDFYFTTIAGEAGNVGSAGGTAAKFNEPWGLAVDGDGNVIVADRFNHTIRKVTPAGIVSTIAGRAGEAGSVDGPADVARFSKPRSVCLDDDGNIYVTDTENFTIRKISTNGMVTTLAGQVGTQGSADGQGAEASFGRLEQITFGVDGRLYAADSGNRSVRRITLEGLVSTYIGAGNFYSGAYLNGIAMNSRGRIYVSDSGNHVVMVIELDRTRSIAAGGLQFGDVDGPALESRFWGPADLAIDKDDNLFIADWGNQKIRKVTPEGVVTSVVGSRLYWGYGGYFDATGEKAMFGYISGLAIDGGGNLYASNMDWHAIRKIAPEGVVTTLAGQPRHPGSADSNGVASLFNMPGGIALDSNSDLIVADTQNGTVRRVTRDGDSVLLGGRIEQHAGLATDLRAIIMDSPSGVGVLLDGDIVVADAASHLIRKITPSGELSILAGGSYNHGADGTGTEANFQYPFGLVTHGDGNSYIADRDNGAIRKITPEGVVTTVGSVSQPLDIAMNSSGDFYIACGYAYTVQKLTHDGVLTTIAGRHYEPGMVDGPASDSRFGVVTGIAVDEAGYVYVVDSTNKTIRMITPDGFVTTIGGFPGVGGSGDGFRIDSRFDSPWDIAIDGSGALFITDSSNHTIRMGAHPRGPVFDLQPSERRAIEGWSVVFEAHADAYPKPLYQWKRGGIDIPGATGATFTIESVGPGDFANYTVVATNMAGEAESQSAKLALPDPPEVVGQPTVKTVVLGGSVTFGVALAGTPPFTYQWRRNGVAIAGATDSSLTLSNVEAWQGGNYSVVVSNAVGSVTSNAAALTIDTNPRLINVSCRGFAGTGDDTLVMGFYITGTSDKTLLIRGVGPKLADFIPGEVVADPRITVYRGNTLLEGNDDWDAALAPEFARMGGFPLTPGSKDAAMMITLAPGGYTVHLVNTGAVAEGLIEVYDLSRDLGSRLTNVSCRLNMKPGQIIILGTALIGSEVSVLARNVGPALAAYLPEGASVLADPHLRIYRGTTEIAINDDWEAATGAYFGPTGAFSLPAGSKDAAIRVPFTPGGVTIHATGKSGTGGIAIIELYESP